MSVKKTGRVNIRIDADIREWIDAKATERRRDVSEIVRDILLDAYLAEQKLHKAAGSAIVVNGSNNRVVAAASRSRARTSR